MSPSEIRRALVQNPVSIEGWRQLAFQCFAESAAVAASAFARALALLPSAVDWSNLAEALRTAGLPGAGRAARRALATAPTLAAAHNNLGSLLMQEDRADLAGGVFARTLALQPEFREAAYNRAAAFAESGEPDRAIRLYDAVLARFPDFFEARWNRTLALLASGRWREGWRAHEIRRTHPGLAPRVFTAPDWDGAALAGRRILLAAEQGFGDTIQFLRYVPEVKRRGGTTVLDVQPALLELTRTLSGVDFLIASGAAVPAVDVHAPLMSLPLLLGPEQPPPPPPYLQPDPAKRALWRSRLAGDPRPKVGVAWAGNPDQRNDPKRSLADRALAPLLGVETVRFVSLQKGRKSPQTWFAAALELANFADTAALIAELDLVIAVDTAVAHVAGALGKPLWVLLSPAADWRWPRGQPRTPWYPSARQIWRSSGEEWEPALIRLAARLSTAPLDHEMDFP